MQQLHHLCGRDQSFKTQNRTTWGRCDKLTLLSCRKGQLIRGKIKIDERKYSFIPGWNSLLSELSWNTIDLLWGYRRINA